MSEKFLIGQDLVESEYQLNKEKQKYRIVKSGECITLEVYDGVTLIVNDKNFVIDVWD